jgi:hypothetical protein
MRFLFIDSRFTPHASFPHSVDLVQLRFTSCDQLMAGLAPTGVRTYQAHKRNSALRGLLFALHNSQLFLGSGRLYWGRIQPSLTNLGAVLTLRSVATHRWPLYRAWQILNGKYRKADATSANRWRQQCIPRHAKGEKLNNEAISG